MDEHFKFWPSHAPVHQKRVVKKLTVSKSHLESLSNTVHNERCRFIRTLYMNDLNNGLQLYSFFFELTCKARCTKEHKKFTDIVAQIKYHRKE